MNSEDIKNLRKTIEYCLVSPGAFEGVNIVDALMSISRSLDNIAEAINNKTGE